ncbi:MAG: hypothetical protein HOO99_07115 [Hyphomicrobiaceae bacterium]|nr:hypothetical protein [Hyphomicrobiaceae bacterium]
MTSTIIDGRIPSRTTDTLFPWFLAVAAGTTFTLASAGTNLLYGIAKSPELPLQIVWGAVAVAASIALALAPAALLRSRSVAGVLFSLAAIALFGTFSLSSALGSFFGGRAATEVQQTAATGTRTRFEKAYDAARIELEGLAVARPVAELEAVVAKLKATPGANGCTKVPDGPISRTACGDAATVAVELGRAMRRAELEGQMSEARDALGKAAPPKVVNADALALSTFAGKLGVVVTPDALNPWLALLSVALVEFGGGICFAVAGVFSVAQVAALESKAQEPGRSTRPVHVEQVESTKAASGSKDADFIELARRAKGGTTAVPKLTIADGTAERLLLMVAQHGTELLGSNRTFGKALGVSHTQAGRVINELEATGRVTVARGKSGTVVKLARAA